MITPGRVLVTGASGFVGGAVLGRLSLDGWQVRGSTRESASLSGSLVELVTVPDVGPTTDWKRALAGVTTVVHCAARVHVMRDTAADPLAEFRRVNLAGTLNLARQAAKEGLARFIFVSSIGVNGAETVGLPFTADDKAEPDSPYAISKYEAETNLRQLSEGTGLELVIVRPPLVFGANAPGNFQRLLRAVRAGIPLPFGAIRNQRSLVSLDNLVDLLVTCIRHPAAAGQLFLVSDGEDLSTTELIRQLAIGMKSSTRLIPVPASILRSTARLLGWPELGQRLCGSLQVDIGKTYRTLGWKPKVSIDDGLQATARDYMQLRRT